MRPFISGTGRPRGLCPLNGSGKVDSAYLSTNPGSDSFADNVDKDTPAEVYFVIGAAPTTVLLTAWSRPFRAYAQGAASGGGQTVSSGGHAHSMGLPNHGHSHAHVHQHGDLSHMHGLSDPDWTDWANPGAGRGTDWPNDSNVGGGGGGTFYTNADNAPHDHAIPAHVHNVTYGIYEYKVAGIKKYAGVQLFINDPGCTSPIPAPLWGVKGDLDTAFIVSDLELISLYVPGAPAVGQIGDGANSIFLRGVADATNTAGLVRVVASIKAG